jgi:tetratricopeptide (TPR) repeat protein
MKSLKHLLFGTLAFALILPAGLALGQNRQADIDQAKQTLESSPSPSNRERLATLQYLQGVDYLNAGNMEMATTALQEAVETLDKGEGQIPEHSPVYEEARYGLAFALWKADKPYDALLYLEQLANSSPKLGKARYLLGSALISISGKKSYERGVEVFIQLAQDGTGEAKEMAARAATRTAYNESTLMDAQGQSGEGLNKLNSLKSSVGMAMGANDAENQAVQYAMAYYEQTTGDVTGALAGYEDLYKGNPGFALGNGTGLKDVLANAYYQNGVELLRGGAGSAQQALDMFNQSATVGGAEPADVHHGKAIAFALMNDEANLAQEMAAIHTMDPGYYDKIKVMK